MIAGLRDEVGNRDFRDLALERDRLLLALLKTRLAGNP
jgi:hypothetical protein